MGLLHNLELLPFLQFVSAFLQGSPLSRAFRKYLSYRNKPGSLFFVRKTPVSGFPKALLSLSHGKTRRVLRSNLTFKVTQVGGELPMCDMNRRFNPCYWLKYNRHFRPQVRMSKRSWSLVELAACGENGSMAQTCSQGPGENFNGPFYSCLLGLVFELKRGWK